MALTDRPLTASDFEEVPWRDCIARADRRECWSYSRLFFDEAQRCAQAGDEKGKAVFEFFGKICSMMLRPENPGAAFQPQLVLNTGRSAIPDDLSHGEIDLLKQLYSHVEDADLRARCADLVWELARDHRAARVAVEAYFESASHSHDGARWYERATLLRRAVALAAALGKQGEPYRDLLSRLDHLLDERLKVGDRDFGCALMEILLGCGGGDARKLAEWCDRAERSMEGGANTNDARRLLRLAADWYGVVGDEPARQSIWMRAAETHVADGNRAREGENPMAAVRHYESAIEVMRRLPGGGRERVEEIRRELAEVQEAALGQMQRFSTPFDVSEMVRGAQESVSGKALGEALETLALAGKPPAVEQLRKEVEQLAGKFPLKHLISMVVVDGRGRKLGERGPLDPRDEDYERSLEVEMLQHASFYRRLHAVGVIEPMRQTIVNEHRITEATLLPVLGSNPFVPGDRILLFARGLSAGFYGDYLVASHILIPQLENSLRTLLANCGEAVTSMDADGVEQLFGLDRILGYTRTGEILGQDMVFDLRGLLVEKTSANLRHRLAHGLMSDADFLTTDAAYLWWVALRLCMIPVVYRRRAARKDNQKARADPKERTDPVTG